jgi:Tol biopolymer transport system component
LVVFRAVANGGTVAELFSVSIAGGTPIRINEAMFSWVGNYLTSPDSSTVLYTDDARSSSGGWDLFSAPIDGSGVPVRLNGNLVTNGAVRDFELSLDGSNVVYMADQEAASRNELYSVPVAGGTVIKLNPQLPLGGRIYSATITPDSSTVVYNALQEEGGPTQLYRVPITGGAAERINDPLSISQGIYEFKVSPDGTAVSWITDEIRDDVEELFVAPLDLDPDGDGKLRFCDTCPAVSNADQAADTDFDADGLACTDDNCPLLANADQADQDFDGHGDLCDNCSDTYNPDQTDQDGDAIGDACDDCPDDPVNDGDGDGFCTADDNCPSISNPGQRDVDDDGLGDECDPCPFEAPDDADGDGYCFSNDNCGLLFNPLQADTDGDGVGDLCDNCPADVNSAQNDTDGDGAGDLCDCQFEDPTDLPPDAIAQLVVDRLMDGEAWLSWTPTVGADRYSITRGDLSSLTQTDYGACLAEGLETTNLVDPTLPAPGDGFTYLVQAQNFECGLGSQGFASWEVERHNADPAACAGEAHADAFPASESSVLGTVSGELSDVAAPDGAYEAITEKLSGGSPPNRFSQLEHRWTIDVPSGSRIELHVEGFRTSNIDKDDFVFEYSTDEVSWIPISLPSLPFADQNTDLVGLLASPLPATVTIRVRDTNRTAGYQTLDTVSIDELFIRSIP